MWNGRMLKMSNNLQSKDLQGLRGNRVKIFASEIRVSKRTTTLKERFSEKLNGSVSAGWRNKLSIEEPCIID